MVLCKEKWGMRSPLNYIPVDFLKGEIIGLDSDYFLKNNYLYFTPVLDKENKGNIRYQYVEHMNMRLRVYPNGRIFISGSLHKFYNEGEHNHNQFSESAFKMALNRLHEVFLINPENIRLICLEYGLNITPPIPTNDVLDNLLQYKNKDFELKIGNERARYYQCQLSTFIIKIYNKGLQHKLCENVLRLEIKQTNWSEYRKNNVVTLEDFFRSNKEPFISKLLKVWDEVVFFDPTNKVEERWSKYSNINFWRALRQKSRATTMRHRRNLKEINRNGLDVQTRIGEILLETLEELQTVTNITFSNEDCCLLTGVDISMQRKGSKLLSHKGLRCLVQRDVKLYERIKNKYLSSKWIDANEYKQIKEIAHNIRSHYSNGLRKRTPHQLELF